MEKSVVLIDAENVFKNWSKYCSDKGISNKIDYKKMVDYLSKDTNLIRAYFYDGVPDNIPPKKKEFLYALEHRGIQLRTKFLKKRTLVCMHCKAATDKYIQKGVDVSLATDLLRHGFQNSCDICIIVSGDEDYIAAIELVKDEGIKVWVCSFDEALSINLKRTADKVILLDDIFDNIIQK